MFGDAEHRYLFLCVSCERVKKVVIKFCTSPNKCTSYPTHQTTHDIADKGLSSFVVLNNMVIIIIIIIIVYRPFVFHAHLVKCSNFQLNPPIGVGKKWKRVKCLPLVEFVHSRLSTMETHTSKEFTQFYLPPDDRGDVPTIRRYSIFAARRTGSF